MSGFITKQDVLDNAAWIIETYGKLFFYACLLAENETYLGVLMHLGMI